MPSAVFVHVSDIHFGQERDELLHIHDDVKQELIADAGRVVRSLAAGAATGILVTGDIAQSGKREQYSSAAIWLDALAKRVGSPIHRIQMVPGNHDLDRDLLSFGGAHVLSLIREGGVTKYEEILASEPDRAALYARFREYGNFSEGYDCILDREGRFSANLKVELAPGRAIRFILLNSSLLCTGDEHGDKPELIMGGRQFTIPRNDGEETIVLMHHPLHWLKDSQDAETYLRSRARVLITGHEHNPKVRVDPVEAGSDFMMLAAGATVPFKSTDDYTFTYNILEFDWDAQSDALEVKIHPRAWDRINTRFDEDSKRLGEKRHFSLGSPYFRRGAPPVVKDSVSSSGPDAAYPAPVVEIVAAATGEPQKEQTMPTDQDGYRLVLLQFFRDLSESDRLRILVALNALPPDYDDPMTQAIERQCFDWLVRKGSLPELKRLVSQFISNNQGDQNK